MKKTYYFAGVAILLAGVAYLYFTDRGSDRSNQMQNASEQKMTFFVTGANPGKGADLGGISGADEYCQMLATGAGAGDKTWHAYLSVKVAQGQSAINARDRIGNGPWTNAKGIVIAENLEQLHAQNNLNKETALTEKGETVKGRGDNPNQHDILTGSSPDGRVIEGDTDTTCANWTSGGAGAAMVGHHDRIGTSDTDQARSWNSSHLSRGCSLENLAGSGGGGLLYCFAQ